MEAKNLEETIARLDAQLPFIRVEMNKTATKVDKIDADQRKTMVLFEDTEGKFKLVLDAYIGINKNIEDLRGRIDRLESRMMSLETFMKEGFELLSRKLDLLARPVV